MAITATTTVPIDPGMRPMFLNAIGIAKIPDPNEDFSRWKKAPMVLKNEIIIIAII